MSSLTINLTQAPLEPLLPSVDTPRTRKRKAQALLLKKDDRLRSKSGYLLRCLGDENQPQAIPSTDSPFRWAKRQAKMAATSSLRPAAPSSPTTSVEVTAMTMSSSSSSSSSSSVEVEVEVEVDAAGDPRAKEEDVVVVLERSSLKPSKDASLEREQMIRHLKSTVWSEVYYAVESFRRLCIHHPSEVSSDLDSLLLAVCESAKALRSAVARNSLLALSDAFVWDSSSDLVNPISCCSDDVLDVVVFTLLEQGAADKSFLRKAAEEGMMQLTSSSVVSSSVMQFERIFTSLSQHVHHKRPKIPALVGKYCLSSMCSCLETTQLKELASLSTTAAAAAATTAATATTTTTTTIENIENPEEETAEKNIFVNILRTFSTLLTAKDPEGRKSGQRGFKSVRKMIGEKELFVRLLRKLLPSHETGKALKAAGIVNKSSAAPKRMSLKEKMRLAKLQMAKMKMNKT